MAIYHIQKLIFTDLAAIWNWNISAKSQNKTTVFENILGGMFDEENRNSKIEWNVTLSMMYIFMLHVPTGNQQQNRLF
jgi:hypothetical protein